MSFLPMPSRLDCLVAIQFKFIIKGINDCWPWIQNFTKDGYGHFGIKGKHYLAHRIAFFLANNYINDKLLVIHSCDNPPCMNPKHLLQGTSLNNIEDAINKGRWPNHKGENNNQHKLNNQKILEIRNKYLQGKSLRQLAKEYNVSHTLISLIINYKIWKHI